MLHIILADGFEEIEAVTTIDVLRRCGLEVQVVSAVNRRFATGAHGIMVMADSTYRSSCLSGSECIILPGGLEAAKTLAAFDNLKYSLTLQNCNGGLIAAICAAPMVLGAAGVLRGRRATCYPGFESYLKGCECVDGQVVEDGNLITANGPGAAMPFAFAIAARFVDAMTIEQVRRGMILPKDGCTP